MAPVPRDPRLGAARAAADSRVGAASRACASASSMTASSPTRSAAPSAGTATSPSASPRTGHEVTYLTLRQWERGERRRSWMGACDVIAVGPRLALYTEKRPAADPAAARLRRRRAVAPAAPRAPLRRRAHRVVSVLLAARRRRSRARRPLPRWSSTGTRSGAPTTGASTSAGVGGRVGQLVQRALRARAPARVLLLAPARRTAARRGPARGGRRCSRASTRARWRPRRHAAEPVVVFAGRLIPEKRAPLASPASPPRARGSPGCGASSTATDPSARRLRAAIAAHGAREVISAPGFVEASRSTPRCAGRCACCCPPAARATAWSWWRPPRAPPRAGRRRRRQRRLELDRGRRQRLYRGGRRPRRSPTRSCACTSRAGAAPEHLAWFAANAQRLSLEASLQQVLASYAD